MERTIAGDLSFTVQLKVPRSISVLETGCLFIFDSFGIFKIKFEIPTFGTYGGVNFAQVVFENARLGYL